jgi:hypothetical protein
VKCRSCGHEIAANAIVCYRCGTPTAVETPARPPVETSRGRRRTGLIVVLIVVVVAVAALVFFGGEMTRHLL